MNVKMLISPNYAREISTGVLNMLSIQYLINSIAVIRIA